MLSLPEVATAIVAGAFCYGIAFDEPMVSPGFERDVRVVCFKSSAFRLDLFKSALGSPLL